MTRRSAASSSCCLLVVAGAVPARLPLLVAPACSPRGSRAFFHRPVTVGAVRYRLFPLEVEIRDLRVAGATPGGRALPRGAARRGRRRRLAPLLGPPRSCSRACALERPARARPRLPAGRRRHPRLSCGGRRAGEVRIRRLVVEGGELDARPPARARSTWTCPTSAAASLGRARACWRQPLLRARARRASARRRPCPLRTEMRPASCEGPPLTVERRALARARAPTSPTAASIQLGPPPRGQLRARRARWTWPCSTAT